MPDPHRPTVYSEHRYWSTCACGWTSGPHTTAMGAHFAFGEHLAPKEAANV